MGTSSLRGVLCWAGQGGDTLRTESRSHLWFHSCNRGLGQYRHGIKTGLADDMRPIRETCHYQISPLVSGLAAGFTSSPLLIIRSLEIEKMKLLACAGVQVFRFLIKVVAVNTIHCQHSPNSSNATNHESFLGPQIAFKGVWGKLDIVP